MALSRKTSVLRLAVIVGRAIITERRIPVGEPVTVGTDPGNTVVLPEGTAIGSSFLLFEPSEYGYTLRFTQHVGRVSKVRTGGVTTTLDQLIKGPRSEHVFSLPLAPTDRGTLDLMGATLLFQVVDAPPILPLGSMKPVSYRAPLLEEDDPVFLGFLSMWSALALVLAVWVWSAELPVYTLESLPPRVVAMHLPPIIPSPQRPQRVAPEFTQPTSERVAFPTVPAPATGPVTAPSGGHEIREQVGSRAALLRLIGSVGGDSEGIVSTAWGHDDRGLGVDLDQVLQANRGGVATDENDPRLRLARNGGGEPLSIGELIADGVGGGPTALRDAPELQVELTIGEGQVDEAVSDVKTIRDVIRRSQGQLRFCYERELKRNPKLHGRVELELEIYGGAVEGASVLENLTGSRTLAECMVARAKRWRFPTQTEGAVVWPFVFRVK